jgi:hypothetical protein
VGYLLRDISLSGARISVEDPEVVLKFPHVRGNDL